jgi:arginyl-tRNA synthetase
MLITLRNQLEAVIRESLQDIFKTCEKIPVLELDVPADKRHGDYSTNIALKSAKFLKKAPMEIAGMFCPLIEDCLRDSPLADMVERIEVKKPGFINIYLSQEAFYHVIYEVLEKDADYGRQTRGQKQRVLMEFVSANPTGPLSVAHARQAAVGDSLANILNYLGFEAHKEYYVNDGGNQIRILGESIKARALENLGEHPHFPDHGYQGDYIRQVAHDFLDARQIKTVAALEQVPIDDVADYGRQYLLKMIRQELDDFRVHFDQWTFESEVATPDNVEKLLAFLNKKGLTYEKEGALWFATSQLGDDKDRVVRKSDGTYTYLTPDMVYHQDKYARGYQRLIDILGPDHHGYILRLKAAAHALGKEPDSLNIEIVQLATIYRNGKKISMSTRGGQYIRLREVIDEVGVDAARFFFLMRHMSVHLDFDLEIAKQETAENPVYYIQYAHARINSINMKATAAGVSMRSAQFYKLTEAEEIELIKSVGRFGDALESCYQRLDPYPLVSYLQRLASRFHKFYDTHKVLGEDLDLSSERLSLINAVRIVLGNGLELLGLHAPQKM